MEEKLLDVKNLIISFKSKKTSLKAVDDISFSINKGEVFAIVGESGCGKSTTAMGVMGLIKSLGEISGGEIIFDGEDLLKKSEKEMAGFRGSKIGMIFQNPLDSLNPVYTAGSQVAEGFFEDRIDKVTAWSKVEEVFQDVKISDHKRRMKSYPHEMSGGMRQRVMIGMMLCRNPKLLIADEPTTALDVTIQAGIIQLIDDLRRKYNTAVMMITHDFGIVADIADRVAVMYAGKIVEIGSVFDIFESPAHPYTGLLMKALPRITKREGRLETIKGSIPDLSEKITGCKFALRCPYAKDICYQKEPALKNLENNRMYACFRGCGDE